MKQLRDTLERTVLDTAQTMQEVGAAFPQDASQSRQLHAAVQALEQSQKEAQRNVTVIEAKFAEYTRLAAVGAALEDRVESLREQLAQVYETISLGLTAEALAHEIQNVADQLAYRNREITQYLRRRNITDAKLIAYTAYVTTSVAALRKQLSHLAPALRYVREKRDKILLADFFAETLEYYRARFARSDIDVCLDPIGRGNFTVHMNRGKLIQIIDNLFLNSEYWLREDLRLGHLTKGVIAIEVARPFVRISDNGRGIAPSVESSVFEAFVTTKGSGRGRGLGLFIVRQLLDSEGCSIALRPERNSHGRPYIFELNLTGALYESE